MNQDNDATLKCQNSEDGNGGKLECQDDTGIRNEIDVSHTQEQQEQLLKPEQIQTEYEEQITSLNNQMDLAQQQFSQLIIGIRSKCQKSKQQFLNLNPQYMNSFSSEKIQFKLFEQHIQLIQQSIKAFQDSMEKLSFDLKLYFNKLLSKYNCKSIITESDVYQVSNLDINKSEELYQKGYKLKVQDLRSIIYLDDDNYEEAIKVFDESLSNNPKHKLSLWCKGVIIQQYYSGEFNVFEGNYLNIKMIGQYKEAIIWVDKALQIDPTHCQSLYCKAESLIYQNEVIHYKND